MNSILSKSSVLRFITVAALVFICIWGLRLVGSLLAPIFFAFTLAVLLYPALRGLVNRGMPRSLAIVTLVLGVVAVFAVLILVSWSSISQIIDNMPTYSAGFQAHAAPLVEWLDSWHISWEGTAAFSEEKLQQYLGWLVSLAGGLVANVIFVALFLFTLLLISSDDLLNKIHARLGADHRFVAGSSDFAQMVRRQYALQTFSNFMSGVVTSLMLWYFGVDFFLFWGLLAFVMGYVPNIGLIIALVPAVVLAFAQYGFGTAALIFVLAIILNLAMDNVVTPRIMGKGLDIPVVFVFGSFVFWTWMFGIFGTLISLPLTVALRSWLIGSGQARLFADVLSGSDTQDKPKPPAVSGAAASAKAK